MNWFGFIAFGIIIIIIVVVIFKLTGPRSMSQEAKRILRREILENGKPAEATVVSAVVHGTSSMGELRNLVIAEFSISPLGGGASYVWHKIGLAVPLQVVPDLKKGNVLPVTVHPTDPQIILFDFDKHGSHIWNLER